MDVIIYEGKKYTRTGARWVDRDQFVVSLQMQDILNARFIEEQLSSVTDRGTLIENADKLKASGSYQMALRFYFRALDGAEKDTIRWVLPKIASCYRSLSLPAKAVEVFEEYVDTEGEEVVSVALLISAAAAYCDINNPKMAHRLCKWAYKKCRKAEREPSDELRAVFGRVAKMLDLPPIENGDDD